MPEFSTDMRGKTCLVTGATSGIGKETALGLARLGAHVLIVARDRGRGEAALADLQRQAPRGSAALLLADLSSLDDVRRLAGQVRGRGDRLDVLVNNAGVALVDRRVTADGLEATFATNYLGPFLLTNLLLEPMVHSGPARIVNVASETHKRVRDIPWDDLQSERKFAPTSVYNLTKLLDVLFTYELARRLRGTRVVANCLHPGWPLETNLGREATGAFALLARISRRFAASAADGARTSVYLASDPEIAGVSGGYFANSAPVASSALSRDEAAASRLWDLSERHCGLQSVALPFAGRITA